MPRLNINLLTIMEIPSADYLIKNYLQNQIAPLSPTTTLSVNQWSCEISPLTIIWIAKRLLEKNISGFAITSNPNKLDSFQITLNEKEAAQFMREARKIRFGQETFENGQIINYVLIANNENDQAIFSEYASLPANITAHRKNINLKGGGMPMYPVVVVHPLTPSQQHNPPTSATAVPLPSHRLFQQPPLYRCTEPGVFCQITTGSLLPPPSAAEMLQAQTRKIYDLLLKKEKKQHDWDEITAGYRWIILFLERKGVQSDVEQIYLRTISIALTKIKTKKWCDKQEAIEMIKNLFYPTSDAHAAPTQR